MPKVIIRFFQLEDGICPLIDWLDTVTPKKAKAKVLARILLLESLGHEIRRPHADLLEDGIYELRERFMSTQFRVLFFFHGQGVVVVSHGFTKHGASVPSSEIERAKVYKTMFLKNPEKHTYEE